MDNPFKGYTIKVNKKAPPHKRAFWQQQIADLTGWRFKFILGFTREFTIGELQEIYEKAMGWKVNPAALCKKLIKEKKGDIDRKLGRVVK
jgi:hypothetical protein